LCLNRAQTAQQRSKRQKINDPFQHFDTRKIKNSLELQANRLN